MKRFINASMLLTTALIGQYTYALPDDINKPLEIQADEASFDQNSGQAIYKGNVFVKQGSIEIQAEYLKVSTDANTRKFSSLEASGSPAKFSQQVDWSGNIVISKGNEIHYQTDESKLEIIGDGYLSRIQNSITADYILYMIQDGTFSAEKKDSGRVSMTLQPQAPEAKQ
ncbi:MAG: lipopolysaccharide transport periplasmic protein LptA [Marinomonas sp.]|jgi:lipopolysaccharide export system protein LptA|uniref:Lipopolysaccharide export system protein LptA n=1 Tax=Marinomonas pontica TaxID=264739 RepID=A0ABM8FEW9_9GAMM|nr:lipopolysaccharide transport periplasmic protein LptA [Marinomonas pontica]MCW8356620.1 lipopolysaccharide transport periplasmic protein LptA [Marinomonas pontica]BDX02584.1 lipopolysaccharide export system protein LptA [Marinomonas pontica]